jgi:N-formylglutamate deformylase
MDIIVHIPHASVNIPFYSGYSVNEAVLRAEQMLLTDWFTDDLFNHPNTIPVIADFSRIFCDVERFPEDSDEPMARTGMGMIYETCDDGRPLRKVTPAERATILSQYYKPHHEKLQDAVEHQLDQTGSAFILDCHSFPDTPFKRDVNQLPNRPDFNIGTDSFHTPEFVVDAAADFFKQEGSTLGINWPYQGTVVPLKFYHRDKRVISLMLEVNRRLYLVQGKPPKNNRFKGLKDSVSRFLEVLRALPVS